MPQEMPQDTDPTGWFRSEIWTHVVTPYQQAAAKELLEATRRHEEELRQREAVLEEILLGGKRQTYGRA